MSGDRTVSGGSVFVNTFIPTADVIWFHAYGKPSKPTCDNFIIYYFVLVAYAFSSLFEAVVVL